MSKKILVMVLAMVASALLATPFIGSVFATEFIPVNFTSVGGDPVSVFRRQAGESGNWISTAVYNLLWEGDFVGAAVMEVRLVFHNFGTPDMTYEYYQTVTFTGTFLQEYAGTLTIVAGQGNWRIVSGTGELYDLRGQGKMQMIGPGTWSFTGQAHFEP